MATDHYLADIIKGRTISGTQNRDDNLTISFTDGSQMTIKTAGSSNIASTGGMVADVRQEDTVLYIDMEGGSSFAVTTPETSSVVVRDKSGAMEYTD
jgi:hypothetical protein